MKEKVYSKLDKIPEKTAPDTVVEGCMVLEGGAFRGVYAEGVLDVLMGAGINLSCTIGVSAGALNGINYLSGQIGRAARMNLGYRHDKRYVGLGCYPKNKGIIGFDFALEGAKEYFPMDEERFYDSRRRFVVTATNCETGEQEYFDRDTCGDIFTAIKASASLPYVSDMVNVDGKLCLDGGCYNKIPYKWALEQGFQKIVLVRTRHEHYRKGPDSAYMCWVNKVLYHKYPKFRECLDNMNEKYNHLCEDISRLEAEGKMFVISPSKNWKIARIESNMEKLGKLYWLGVRDMKARMGELLEYLRR